LEVKQRIPRTKERNDRYERKPICNIDLLTAEARQRQLKVFD